MAHPVMAGLEAGHDERTGEKIARRDFPIGGKFYTLVS